MQEVHVKIKFLKDTSGRKKTTPDKTSEMRQRVEMKVRHKYGGKSI